MEDGGDGVVLEGRVRLVAGGEAGGGGAFELAFEVEQMVGGKQEALFVIGEELLKGKFEGRDTFKE